MWPGIAGQKFGGLPERRKRFIWLVKLKVTVSEAQVRVAVGRRLGYSLLQNFDFLRALSGSSSTYFRNAASASAYFLRYI